MNLFSRIPGLLGLLALTASCAVTRIDVDVYKGPLANDEDVQVQQFAAMAIGAKPLLIQLRDRLEWGKGFAEEIEKNESSSWYKATYVPQPVDFDEGQPNWFRNHHARSVNNLLSLYDDTIRNDLNKYIEDGFVTLSQYRNAHALAAPDKEKDEKVWRDVSKKMRDFPEFTAKAKLKTAWGLFFYPHGFTGDDPNPAKWRYRKTKGLQRLIDLVGPSFELVTPLDREADVPEWQLDLYILRDTAVLERHANVLFNDDEFEASQLFKIAVSARVEAIFARRKAITSLWRTANRANHYAGSPAFSETEAYKKNSGGEFLRSTIIADASRIIAFTTNLQNLRHLLWSKEFRADEDLLFQNLYAALDLEDPDTVWRPLACSNNGIEEIKEGWHQNANASLILAFVRDPQIIALKEMGHEASDLASLLIRADTWLIRQASEAPGATQVELSVECERNGSNSTGIAKVSIIGAEFGLGRNFGEDVNSEAIFSQVVESTSSFAEGAAAGLEGGRLRPGITTLIERYVDATDEFPRDGELIAERQLLLSEALVRFAEKVLVIANYDVLLRDQFGSQFQGDFSGIRKYTRVLQAVGNTITVQGNELVVRAKYKDEIIADTNREIRGFKEALNIPPEEYLAGLIAGLSGKRDKVAAALANSQAALAKAKDWEAKSARFATATQTFENWAAGLSALGETGPVEMPQNPAFTLTAMQVRLLTIKRPTTGTKDGMVLKADVLQQLQDEQRQQSRANNPASPSNSGIKRVEQLNKAIALVETLTADDLKDVELKHDGKTEKAILDFLAVVEGRRNMARDAEQAAAAPAREARTVLDEALEKIEFDRKEMKPAAVVAALEALVQRLTSASQRLADTVAVLIDIQSANGLGLGGNGGKDLTANQVHVKLLALVQKREAEAQSGSATERQNANARKTVKEIPTPQSPALAEIDDARNSKDVMDQLLSALRHEHVQAIRQYGEKSNRAEQLAQAVHAAEIHRSGMVYTRPSAVYLKSSYPASTLQGDPGLGWTNMLQNHALRAMPIAGPLFAGIMEPTEDLKIQSEIDKQFWQTINSVRVAGAGTTNYVMAKDDIGNWYVKTYSADPKDIINSAKNLALFGLGGQLNSNLLAGGTGPGESGADSDDIQKARTTTVLDRFQERYNEKAVSAFDTLHKDLQDGAIADQITSAWKNNACIKEAGLCTPDSMTEILKDLRDDGGPLKTAAAAMEKGIKKVEERVPEGSENRDTTIAFEKGDQIVVGLHGLRRFQSVLAARVRSGNFLQSVTADAQERHDEKKSADSELENAKLALTNAEKRLDDAVSQGVAQSEDGSQKNFDKLIDDKNEKAKEVTAAQTAVSAADAAFSKAQAAFERAQAAVELAIETARQAVVAELENQIAARKKVVEELEQSVIVLGQTIAPEKKTAANDNTAAAVAVPGAATDTPAPNVN